MYQFAKTARYLRCLNGARVMLQASQRLVTGFAVTHMGEYGRPMPKATDATVAGRQVDERADHELDGALWNLVESIALKAVDICFCCPLKLKGEITKPKPV